MTESLIYHKMKYMTFNSSCPYAGLANMLEQIGIDTEDYQIALDMGLPYFLRYDSETKCYQGGASLQTAEWFNIYLKPRGYHYVESAYEKSRVPCGLKPGAMLGIQVAAQSKHAVIFLGIVDEKYIFLNNKWERAEEPERLELSEGELLSRLPEVVIVGHLERCGPEQVDITPYLQESLEAWERLRAELQAYIAQEQSPKSLRDSMNRLFRPLLLDGLTMMQLLKHEVQIHLLTDLQRKYLTALRSDQSVRLADIMEPRLVDRAIDGMVAVIRNAG